MLQTTSHKRSIKVVRLADMIVALIKTERKRQHTQPVLPEMVAQTEVSDEPYTLVGVNSCPERGKEYPQNPAANKNIQQTTNS